MGADALAHWVAVSCNDGKYKYISMLRQKQIQHDKSWISSFINFLAYNLWLVLYNNAPVSWLHWRVIAHYVLASILDISHWSMTENTYAWTGYLASLTKVFLRFCNHILKAILLRDDCDIIVNWVPNHVRFMQVSVCLWFNNGQAQVDGLVHDCSNSIAYALVLLQSCTKPSRWLLNKASTIMKLSLYWKVVLKSYGNVPFSFTL